MRRFIQLSFFLYFVLVGASQYLVSQEEEENNPRYLIPKKPQGKPTYESLTEERGTLKQNKERKEQAQKKKESAEEEKKLAQETPTINFNNVSITEVLKYVSRLTGKNFAYDPQELQYSITMISDSPTSLEEIIAMVIQSLRVHGFSILEEGDTYVIHTNPGVRGAGGLYQKNQGIQGPQIATEVFLLQNIDAGKCAALVKTMVSDTGLVETISNTKLIISDVTENLKRISEVIKKLDSESEGLEIGQYVAIAASPHSLATMAERLITPMAGDKPLVLVPHRPSNSIFIVSTHYLIDKAISVMRTIDLNEQKTGLLSEERKKALAEEAKTAPGETNEAERRIEALTLEELRKRLLEQGLTEDQVNSLNLDAAREAYKQTHRTFETGESNLPLGTVEATQFLIYKLQYRKNSDVSHALRAIADSLAGGSQPGAPGAPAARPELAQSDLIITLNSLQDLDDNNTIVFTGTKASLEKVKNLISQIDIPVRQVFIEALVLDTSLTNSLQFGVQWKGKIQRTNLGAEIGYRDPSEANSTGSFATAFSNVQQYNPVQVSPPPEPIGFSTGFIGRKIKFLGKGFRSTGALIKAIQYTSETHIIMNPKIVTEHNVPAEVFVGQQIPIKGQSIANASVGSTSSVVATNYTTQEIGVSLKVTPLISSHETVTLILEQKVSNASAAAIALQGQDTGVPATVSEARTITRVHLPSDHFLVLSGLISEEHDLINDRIPCLGCVPLIGALFGTNIDNCSKRNLMIFIRPIIIDNEIDIDEITKNQDQLTKQKCEVGEGQNKCMDQLESILNLNGGCGDFYK